MSDLAKRDAPLLESWSLIVGKVFVEHVHAAANSESFLGRRRPVPPCNSCQASPASRTASATAARGIFPLQRVLQIKSQERPAAASSKTCQTMMRVPLKVGLPWQISGSATMNRPISTRDLPTLAAIFLLVFMHRSLRLPYFLRNNFAAASSRVAASTVC